MSKQVSITLIYTLTALIIAGGYIYFTQIRPHQVKADCWRTAYNKPRTNENNFKWAPGKEWEPVTREWLSVSIPENLISDPGGYGWIYLDQSETVEGIHAKKLLKDSQNNIYTNCLENDGY